MTFNANTWISFLTSVIGMAGAAAATDGIISSSTATSIGGLATTVVPIVWGYFIHRDSKVVQVASLVQGVAKDANGAAIKILPDAPPALLALAADRSVPTVKPEIPVPSPYATQRRV